MNRIGSAKSCDAPTATCSDLLNTSLKAGVRNLVYRRTVKGVSPYKVGSDGRNTLINLAQRLSLDTTVSTEERQRVLRNVQTTSGDTQRSLNADASYTPRRENISVPIMPNTSSDPRQGSFSLRGICAMSTALLSLRSISGSGSLVTELTRLRGARGASLAFVMLCQCALSFVTGVIVTTLTTMLF